MSEYDAPDLGSNLAERTCQHCERAYRGGRTSKYCSDSCKQKVKHQRMMADPERRKRRQAMMLEVRKRHREKFGDRRRGERKYPDDPDWRKRPRRSGPRKYKGMSDEEVAARKRAVARENNKVQKARRRGRLKAAQVIPFTPEQLAAKFAYWGNRCWMCGGGGDLTRDHVKPLSRGGPHMLSNIRPACVSCNSSKHASWPGVDALEELRLAA